MLSRANRTIASKQKERKKKKDSVIVNCQLSSQLGTVRRITPKGQLNRTEIHVIKKKKKNYDQKRNKCLCFTIFQFDGPHYYKGYLDYPCYLGSVWPCDFAGQTCDLHINKKKKNSFGLRYQRNCNFKITKICVLKPEGTSCIFHFA